MEGGDSDSEEDGVEYSGMEQPPLTKMLKNILSEYPDDGQILKELIQNAEDAEASEVKVLIDGRHINTQDVNPKKRPYYKYFKGPALYFYNNAVFADSDWRGIKMLYSSVKELDPLKVGRFGLGFKSVFHVTDFPMVISGDKLLIIDPHQTDPGKVCQTIRLKNLPRCKKMYKDDYMAALNGVIGFNQETVQTGNYDGTLFRFPLRTVQTELSDNLYSESKLNDLLRTFECEASITLLFLKFLHKIELIECSADKAMDSNLVPRFAVSLSGPTAEDVKCSRAKFSQSIKDLNRQLPPEPINNVNEITIKIETSAGSNKTKTKEEISWLVVNSFHGGEMSGKLRNLSHDNDLSYSPCVGIAAQMHEDPNFKGHVFCFLPLPLEPQSLTGLPVHVNGYFALSQNRRHVKWPSADQIGKHGHLDKAMQWNECLVIEVLSVAYIYLIEQLIQKCKDSGNPKEMVSMVYRIIPPVNTRLDARWKIVMPRLVSGLLQRSIFFTSCNGGQWITQENAVFARFNPGIEKEIQETVKSVACLYNQNLVEVPSHIWELITHEIDSPCYLTPDFVTSVLQNSNPAGKAYTHYSKEQKLHLLQFLVSTGRHRNLENLQLLPLENGRFVEFGDSMEEVFYCTENEVQILWAYREYVLKLDLPTKVKNILQKLATNETFQLRKMNIGHVRDFISKTVDNHLHKRPSYVEWDSSSILERNWINYIWKYLANQSLDYVKNLYIVPVISEHSLVLYKLSSLMILESNNYSSIPTSLSRTLKRFSVVVLHNIPDYVAGHREIMRYVNAPNVEGVTDVITHVCKSNSFKEHVDKFNIFATLEERSVFWKYFKGREQLNLQILVSFLSKLRIFKEYDNSSTFVCIKDINTISPSGKLPVPFPRKLILNCKEQLALAKSLGGKVLEHGDSMLEIFKNINTYSSKQQKELMEYFVSNFSVYESRKDILNHAAKIHFVPTSSGFVKRACDLFDPRSKLLKNLLVDKSHFPESSFCKDQIVYALKKLGMKCEKDITAGILNECAKKLDQVNKKGSYSVIHGRQAECILMFVSMNNALLNEVISHDGYTMTLKASLRDKCFIPPLALPNNYPEVLPWYGNHDRFCSPRELLIASDKNKKLVGCTMPLVSEKIPQNIVCGFEWDSSPPTEKILKQLFKLVELYEPQYKPDILVLLKEIYKALAQSEEMINFCEDRPNFCEDRPCVWTGDGFVTPDRVFVKQFPGEINVEPYMYGIPKEFHMYANFFLSIGCKNCQTEITLQNVLFMIKNKYDNCAKGQEVNNDLDLVVKILNHLKESQTDLDKKNILFPIHTGDDTRLEMKPATECHYCNADWLQDIANEDEEEVVFVHANISHDTAEKLGVPSLTESLFSDAEGMEEWGQSEPLTRRIKNLLKEYKDGFSVPKEIVQNADDAGATKVCFLYDERENLDFRNKLIDEKMSECQGPALWSYNDALFSKADLENITKLSGATKEHDSSKIGKFGLGFCSVYNLTEVPSFVSESDVVIFDPHSKYLGKAVRHKQTGIKINLKSLKNKKLVQRMKNQFQPFQGIFGCHLGEDSAPYKGTLFRFPLRTLKQALESDIDNTAYTKAEMEQLIKMFIEGAGNLLLFSQNVTEINLYHLTSDEENPVNAKVIFSVSRAVSNKIPNSLNICMSSSNTSLLKDVSSGLEKLKMGHTNTIKGREEIYLFNISITAKGLAKELSNISSETSDSEWIISWKTGTAESLHIASKSSVKGILHIASVATLVSINGDTLILKPLTSAPFGFYKESHYFCFMPLPIRSPLPVHINAAFAVSSDRRTLVSKTSDDKYSFESEWNDSLMSDAVPNAYLLLLESLKHFTVECYDSYESLWPTITDKYDKLMTLLHKAFYKNVISENYSVFKRETEWMHFENCKFLAPSFVQSEIGDIVKKTAIHFAENRKHKIISISQEIMECFINFGCSNEIKRKMLHPEEFFSEILFPNLHSEYWVVEDRNKLVCYAIDFMKDSLKSDLQNIKCIPTEPNGRLRKIADVIHPHSEFRDLFSVDDERLIQKGEFHDTERLRTLTGLGIMLNTIPIDVVEEQTKNIERIACLKCSLKRTNCVLRYACQLKDEDINVLSRLQRIRFLPVLEKSNDWPFNWKADSEMTETLMITPDTTCNDCDNSYVAQLQFGAPCYLYHPENKQLLGSQVMFVNTELAQSFDMTFWTKLGVKGCNKADIPVKNVCQQLTELCQNVNLSDLKKKEMQMLVKICKETYQYFNDILSNVMQHGGDASHIIDIAHIVKYPIIFLDTKFIYPDQVAKMLSYDCSPYLFEVPSYGLKNCTYFLKAIGVKEHFSLTKVVEVALRYQKQYNNETMTNTALNFIKRLMELMTETMENEGMADEQLHKTVSEQNNGDKLCLPDQTAKLVPIHDLCIDDDAFELQSKSMKYVHEIISNQVAKLLGVKSKRKQHLKDHIKKRRFRQKEELTTRIKRILSGYPFDEGILKELLQNADDANATQVHFVTDFRKHSCDRVFDEKWKPLQGPALLVCNDSYFSDKDIEGIQQLGIGSKSDDPTKTGQYGVGFNAVYHLTDAPSFITRGPNVEDEETLCVMDPNCLYTSPDFEEDAGVQYIQLNDLRDEHSDVFAGYHEETLLSKSGTIFRFPLRTKTMAQDSKISTKEVSIETVSLLIEKFKVSMYDALLFLKNVRKITISDITGDDLKHNYTVEANISEENRKQLDEFSNYVHQSRKSLKKEQCFTGIPKEITYSVGIRDDCDHSKSWLVVQRYGFDSRDIPQEIIDACSLGDLGLLPLGGIALPITLNIQGYLLPHKVDNKTCTAFCFLPLPTTTGLPFQVNGHFCLDHEARRNLWEDKTDSYKSLWNKMILKKIVTPCFTSGICTIKNNMVSYHSQHEKKETMQLLPDYHSLFPRFDDAKNDYWKILISAIYSKLLDSELEVFSSCIYSSLEVDTAIQVEFIPVKKKSETFSSVYIAPEKQTFNFIMQNQSLENYQQTRSLERILKRLGLRVLNSPYWLIQSIISAGLDLQEATPDYIIDFLKSYQDENSSYKCRISLEGDDTDICETQFQKPEDLVEIIKFCEKSSDFETKLYGLPLCLTEDSKLHVFYKDYKIFCCEFYSILPNSSRLFLHNTLVSLFEKHTSIEFCPFNIDEFAFYLSDNLEPQTYRTCDVYVPHQETSQILNKDWLKNVWMFIESQIKGVLGDRCDRLAARTFLMEKLGPWCLVPCKKRRYVRGDFCGFQKLLVPVSCIIGVLNTTSFDTLFQAHFDKLLLPSIDVVSLPSISSLTKVIPTSQFPIDVLECLYSHRESIAGLDLQKEDCVKILMYFSNNLQQITTIVDKYEVLKMIKQLKLHVTIQNERVTLDGNLRGMVLPTGIPLHGVERWAMHNQIILLQHVSDLKPLYEFLDFDESNVADFYSRHFLQNFLFIPREYYEVHITYIKNNLLGVPCGGTHSTEQKALIEVLKNTRFVSIHGDLKLVSELYSQYNPLFKEMCNNSQFPPDPYCKWEWREFMELLGLQTWVTDSMFIEYTKTVERTGLKNITPEVKCRSTLLLQELESRIGESSNTFCQEISGIKFLKPNCVAGWRSKMHQQFESGTLVCFSRSVLSKYKDLVWTSCCLIPDGIDHNVLKRLGCTKEPMVEKVIQHLQNISKVLEKSCKDFEEDEIMKLLSKLYDFVSKHQQNAHVLQQELGQTPIVFLPKECMMVICDKIAIDLMSKDVITPYLYGAPREFGMHFSFFERLGAHSELTCKTYAVILQNLQKDLWHGELHVNEKIIVQKVVRGFFWQLYQKSEKQESLTEEDLGVEKLFLPTKQKNLALKESAKVIFPNKTFLERKIKVPDGDSYFIGFDKLEIYGKCTSIEVLKILPEAFRPKLLSEMVTERLSYKIMRSENGFVTVLQDFINSQEFAQGILRLIVNDRKTTEETEIEENKIIGNLKQIQIIEVSELKKEFVFQGTSVDNQDITCAHEEEESSEGCQWKFYAKTISECDIEKWVLKIDSHITRLIESCIGCKFIEKDLPTKMLSMINCPDEIAEMLDRHDIIEYSIKTQNTSRSVLEKPGSFVQPQWHHILDNSFCEFEIGEYVALLVESGDDDSDDVYIYAQVVDKVSELYRGNQSKLHVQYKLLVGNGRNEIRKAFELYKFNRSHKIQQDLVPFSHEQNKGDRYDNEEAQVPKSLKEIFQDVREILIAAWKRPENERNSIIRRLLRKWHPDKNIGNETQATEVFKYIKHIISRLENGQKVSVDGDEDESANSSGFERNTDPMWSSFFETFFSNINRQCNRERERYEEYRQRRHSRTRRRRGGHGSRRTTPEPVPHVREARRWYRQACYDIEAARNLMEAGNEKSYNWICYTCHQGAEKALIAAMFRRDANKVRRDNNLVQLSLSLSHDIRGLSQEMETLTGGANAMRYPDNSTLPADSYTRATAQQAIVLCEKILDRISEEV